VLPVLGTPQGIKIKINKSQINIIIIILFLFPFFFIVLFLFSPPSQSQLGGRVDPSQILGGVR